jgi:capsid portal protein
MNIHGIDIAKSEISLFPEGIPKDIGSRYEKEGCIPHPVNMFNLAVLADSDPTHRACLDLKASMVVGIGYEFLNKKAKENKKFKEFIESPNLSNYKSFQDILDAIAFDYFTFGNCCLDFIKLDDNYALYNIIARDIYVKPEKKNGQIVPGLAKSYHQITKEGYTAEFLSLQRKQEMLEGKHYLAHMYNYSPSSSFYGIPCYLAASPNISENVLIRKYGIRFFYNSARPDMMLLISNGDITEEEVKKITDQLTQHHKSVDNSHRFFILSVEGENAKLDLKELSKTMDGQFLKEADKNRDEIIRLHQIPPKLMGVSSSGSLGSGSETIGALKSFVEISIAPQQVKFEHFINKVLYSMFGFNPEIKLKQIDLTNAKDDAIIYTMLSKIIDVDGKPAMTTTEIREKLELPKEPSGALMPLPKSEAKVNEDGKPRAGVALDQNDKIESLDEEEPNPKPD